MGRCYINLDPEEIDYVIPSNDGDGATYKSDAIKSITIDDNGNIYYYDNQQNIFYPIRINAEKQRRR